MVRKQIYLHKRQNALLKRLSQARGLSEAEIVRQAIEREAGIIAAQATAVDRSAWQELIAFLDKRLESAASSQAYHWNREEIYSERENRWLRDQDHD
jgi:hypothetical protein